MLNKWFGLEGKVALVVGASRGLGREMALALSHAGADVGCVARSVQKLNETVEGIRSIGRRAMAIAGDVTEEEDVLRMVQEAWAVLGGIHILVYSAGILEAKPTLRVTLQDWRRTMETNLTGAFLVCREVGRVMREMGGGRIILIGSAFGDRILPQVLPYVVSKGGLLQMVRNLAFEWARYGIRVNGIAPGYFNTEMAAAALNDPKTRKAVLGRIPLRRVGEPSEIGPLVVYLASEASAYVTGEVIRIDGGQSYFTA